MSEELTLLPCPFCGEEPELEKEVVHFPNSKNNCWAVKCNSENCPVANIAQDGEMGGFIYSWTKDEAIRVWNDRELPDDAVVGVVRALIGLVKINEEHNAAVEKVIGRPMGWKDDYLNAARQALSHEALAWYRNEAGAC